METKKYDVAVDVMRVVAILAVVMIHTSTKILQAGQNDIVGLPLAMFLNQISRFAVALFFMISGFVLELSHKDEGYFNYLKRRVNKILIPYVVWTVIYGLLIYPQGVASLPRLLLFGGASYQLYFIPAILVFYLIFPILHKMLKVFSRFWVMMGILGLQTVFLYRDYYVKPFDMPEAMKIPLLAFGVFVLGMAAAKQKTEIAKFLEKFKWVFIVLAVALGVGVWWEGRSGFLTSGNYYTYYSQWRPSVLAYTMTVAGMMYYWFNKLNISEKMVKLMAGLAFFVFFVHIIVLELLWGSCGKGWMTDVPFWVSVVGISFGLGWMVHKLKFLKRWVG